ncbi:hypothetical protein MGG_03791 [Pyricularia oryzae 70-15]|uniref:EF-hand domain-containing protein n=3 Tax=Pyricularia oryzae TaxID=318829 RepID=G4NHM5_PYRO7|nr:uncharacterized protein MGG_03791 [Pyricularia oryzae 70-15]EHA47735.1 hypothetical protein MGG_03791 [Pyricularia oryzae 70-15]ELQ33704.1 hypothetical protein OOU_Y34scaffold00898g5 [Pyricularia oryzae Y34]KAI7910412.1 hypothetical protein M0657_011382 [Pyricularia oryzae]
MKFITVSAFVLSAITAVSAFCCSGPQCADGTGGTPCCATQSCNIFCCACGGHCRGTSKRSVVPDIFQRDVDSAFRLADVGGNGTISLPQYLKYMEVDAQSDKMQMWEDWFKKHDKNNDGVITIDEISLE